MARRIELTDVANLTKSAAVARLMDARSKIVDIAADEAGAFVMNWQARAPMKSGFMANNVLLVRKGKYGRNVVVPDYRPDGKPSALVINSQNASGPNKGFKQKITRATAREFYDKAKTAAK